MKKTLIIDGNNFSDMDSFYDEIEDKFTTNLSWRIGRNLDAFNDLLMGGFNVFEYEENINVVWTSFSKSQENIGKSKIDGLVEIISNHKHIEFKTDKA